jgi:hypothetical protein
MSQEGEVEEEMLPLPGGHLVFLSVQYQLQYQLQYQS